MKHFFIDFILVLFLICVVNIFFGDYNVSQTMFERSIDQFEENVSLNNETKDSYVTIQDSSDNNVSTFFKGISNGCVKIIEFIVLVFSDFVSMIMTVVVY